MTTSSTGGASPIVSIASNSSAQAAGGSVINVGSLVSQLVTATQAPQQAVINSQTQAVQTQISSLGTLSSALSTFQSALSAIDTPSSFDSQTATSSDQTVFTATASSGAASGTYNVTVSTLAQAQQLLSNAFTGGATGAVGAGTLAISLGSSSFNVTINSTNDSLNAIAAAINGASGNPGITATVLSGTDGAHLLLSSSLTGAANTIQVTETDSGTALAAVTYSATNTAHYTQETKAQDASYSIAGVAATSSTNTIANAIGGVTLQLVGQTAANSSASLTVANDTSTIQGNISSFVSAYNTLAGVFKTLGGYDAATATAGPMMGDGLLSNIENQVKESLYSLVNTGSSSYNSLASVGITTNSDGTLSLNAGTLSNALSTNFGAVSQLFSGTGGVAASLNTQLTAALGSSGPISDESQSLTARETNLGKQTAQLNTQMEALSASLTQQYSALNTLLSSLQTTSAYLTQAFSSLPTVQGTPHA